MFFISSTNPFLFSGFQPAFLSHLGKWCNMKAQVNFKFHEVNRWKKNGCNKHITQYLKK